MNADQRQQWPPPGRGSTVPYLRENGGAVSIRNTREWTLETASIHGFGVDPRPDQYPMKSEE
jgi:hypothetical protein